MWRHFWRSGGRGRLARTKIFWITNVLAFGSVQGHFLQIISGEATTMAISNFNETQLSEVLSVHFSPSQEIRDPDRLFGRDRYLKQINRALASPGRHIFIYGERGVGKTSLAITAGKLQAAENRNFIYIPCGQDTTFFEVVAAIGRSILSPKLAVESGDSGFGFGLNVLGTGANFNYKSGQPTKIIEPKNMAEAYEVLKYVRNQILNQVIVVVDELDRIKNREERAKFSELIKNIGAIVDDFRFILCGIGANVDELIGEHLSTGRMFEPVEVDRLSQDNLWKIIEKVSTELGLSIPRGHLIRVGIISDGFPHFVHLIGQCMIYEMFDDPSVVSVCEDRHLMSALNQALQKAEPSLRKIYQMATEKTKNKLDYEEALWALADRTSTRRQVTEIYDNSYKRIHREHKSKDEVDIKSLLNKEQLNSRLLTMRSDRHANIVIGHGAGWFSFRENVVRGYVRLKAATAKVELAAELTV